MKTLIKTDKNGTKYYMDTRCPKCGGSGYIKGYEHIEDGMCFLCGGSGYHETHWKEYTEEYAQKLADRRLKKARAKSEETNKKFFKYNGMNENGETWVVLGYTYDRKDELKEMRARWNPMFGWHFDHEEEGCVKISIEQVGKKWEDWTWQFDDAVAKVEAIKAENAPKTESEYVGEVGDKVEMNLRFVDRYSFETHYTYHGETSYIYKFADENGNTIVWKTGKYMKLEQEQKVTVKGTIKGHNEYKGDKQTVLTRCKVVA